MLLAQGFSGPQWQQSKIVAWLKRPFSASLLEFSTIALFGLTVFCTQDAFFFKEKLNPLEPLGFYLSFAGLSLIPCLLLISIFSQTPTGLFSRILGSRVMVYLSTLTFGVYLIHIPLLHLYLYPVVLKPHIPQPTPMMLFIYFAGLLGLSALSHHFMEKPFYQWASNRIKAFKL
jgi:peptidoglycan/LPS O-acetylase OafA/YrhL